MKQGSAAVMLGFYLTSSIKHICLSKAHLITNDFHRSQDKSRLHIKKSDRGSIAVHPIPVMAYVYTCGLLVQIVRYTCFKLEILYSNNLRENGHKIKFLFSFDV